METSVAKKTSGRSDPLRNNSSVCRFTAVTPKGNAVKGFGAVWLADSRFSLREKMSFRGAKGDYGAITQFKNP